MKASKIFAFIFGILGTALMLLTFLVSIKALDGTTVITQVPKEATACTQQLMQAFADGDYTTAETLLYGDTKLGDPRQAASKLGEQVWLAFSTSYTYQFNGECYTTAKGLSRDVTITSMDIPGFYDTLYDYAKPMLDEREAEAKKEDNVGQVFHDGKVLDEVMEQIVNVSVVQALAQKPKTVSTTMTLELVNQNGVWQVMPNDALLKAVTGGL